MDDFHLMGSLTCPDTCVIVAAMTTWTERKTVGDLLEQHVAEELTIRGWTVNPWGQGVLTEEVRFALKSSDSYLRWTPDLVAARGESVVLIDCKARMTSSASNRNSIERAAVKAHLQFSAWTDLPVYYVFDNLKVLTPHDVLTSGRAGPHTRVGSGAPYYLVPDALAKAFDALFGTYESALRAWAA